MNKKGIKVLTIEDEEPIRRIFAHYLIMFGYDVLEAEDGKEGIEIFREHNPDVILTDLKMPVMSGKAVLTLVTQESPETPVIIVSGAGDISDAIEMVHLGAWDYVLKPITDFAILDYAINRAIERMSLLKENRQYKEHLEDEIKKRTAELQERYKELQHLNKQLSKENQERLSAEASLKQALDILEKTIDGTIRTITTIAEIRDPYTGGHQQRVAQLAVAIAREMGLSENQVSCIHTAGMLHDIGKIAVPIETLAKPGQLDHIEFMLLKNHPRVGSDILSKIEFSWPIADIVLKHHERLDGSGYPGGLKGDEIPIEAKILAVADVVEAMASHRPYRASLGIDVALDEINKGKGILFDSDAVEACTSLFKEKKFNFVEVYDKESNIL